MNKPVLQKVIVILDVYVYNKRATKKKAKTEITGRKIRKLYNYS